MNKQTEIYDELEQYTYSDSDYLEKYELLGRDSVTFFMSYNGSSPQYEDYARMWAGS